MGTPLNHWLESRIRFRYTDQRDWICNINRKPVRKILSVETRVTTVKFGDSHQDPSKKPR